MLICAGSVMLYLNGTVEKVNQADFTKLSFAIYAIFVGFTIRGGVQSYRVCKKGGAVPENEVIEMCQNSELDWFVADNLFTLGMIGTVLGFIFMLSTAFAGITVLNTIALQGALSKMSLGMSTALYTTAAGLICALILKIQLFDYTNHIEKLSAMCGCEVPHETENS